MLPLEMQGVVTMKRLVCLAFVVLPLAGVAQQTEAPARRSDAVVQQKLSVAANRMNGNLPMMLDRATRLDSVVPGPGRKVTYFVTLVKPLREGIGPAEFARQMRRSSAVAFCSDPEFQPFREDEVSIVKKYSLPSGKFIAQIETSVKDCD